jgi:hypothetical protein
MLSVIHGGFSSMRLLPSDVAAFSIVHQERWGDRLRISLPEKSLSVPAGVEESSLNGELYNFTAGG